jgi:Mg2+/Co2+ transporter CorB
VIHEARAIPEAGQVFTFYGFRFEVLRKIRNRITLLKVTPIAREAIIS